METEIELKFFVSPDIADKLIDKIADAKILKQSSRMLSNTYFDTDDHQLRRHDIGLRIRQIDERYIQTLKTSGRVVAGLHQRPEYNDDLSSHQLDLSLISSDAWPQSFEIEKLQTMLSPLFTTNFQRTQWLIEMDDGSTIEMAFDLGEVRSGDKTDDISEIELELISGQTDALFSLANQISESGGMRLGNLSKAARGYRLAFATKPEEVSLIPFVPLDNTLSIEESFVKTLEHALSHWLKHEQIYFEQHDRQALYQIENSINFILQAYTIFADLIPNRSSSLIRQELQWLKDELFWLDEASQINFLLAEKGQQLKKLNGQKLIVSKLKQRRTALPTEEQIALLMTSGRYCGLILDLSRWILTRDWQPFIDNKIRRQLQTSIKPFADKMLEKSWSHLLNVFSDTETIERDVYLEQWSKLDRNLLTGLFFARLYQDDERSQFRLPWLDVMKGMDDLTFLGLLHTIANELDDKDDYQQLMKWLSRKEGYLLHALDLSRLIGIDQQPYWH
ncbi:inorganic triphosphatase [Vibrio sp. SS-MA-C1-2]|uniref:CYTH and CHAD domain-containing protein n=1 Tax=Vibrio sp. SS-MA-C1-2 TaxID=2908646 RepID=UPI001F3D36F3|nr:inorganic triphosphatase [Vibrio sp. SS-MA-C1-2]UJF19109.1 inorganic triphosphatase [Vibrio sp. SS-MA-C1-2]